MEAFPFIEPKLNKKEIRVMSFWGLVFAIVTAKIIYQVVVKSMLYHIGNILCRMGERMNRKHFTEYSGTKNKIIGFKMSFDEEGSK
jgi:hypothetical protein